MRIAFILVVLVTATSTLVGCQGLERADKPHPAPEMRSAMVFETSPASYQRPFNPISPDTNGSRISLLDRIRGRRPNCPTSIGFACQTAVSNTTFASPIVNACSTCNQVGDCGCQQRVKTVSVQSGKSKNTFKEVTVNDHQLTENAVVPPPPSLKHLPNDGKMMISSKVIENADLSSVVEPEQLKKIPDPSFGIYESTGAPDFVSLPKIEQEEVDDLQTQTNDDENSQQQDPQNINDFTPVSEPIFPELPFEPGALLKNWPVNALPVSSPKVHSDSKTPHTIIPDSLKKTPIIPVPQTPIQDPINERLALVPDQVAEISEQIYEISMQVAEISDHVFEKTQPAAAAPMDTQPAATEPVVETSEPVADVADKPVILKARPKENFSLTDNRVVAKDASPSARNQQQIPIYNVSHHAMNQMGSPYPAEGVRAFPQMDTTNFSSPAVARRAQTQLHLRYESDAKRAQDKLFDIQALIQKEIDRRIREGQLVPVNKQPSVEPESPIQRQTEQTADLNRVPVLQVSQPVIKAEGSTAGRAISQSISLPPRRPAAPAQEFEMLAGDVAVNDEVDGEDCEDSADAEFDAPNLYVPVLEIETLQPQLIEIDVNADRNDDTRFDQGVQAPSRINVQAITGENGATISESNPDQAFNTQSQQSGPIRSDSASASIRNESVNSGNDVMLRLRATASPSVPQQSPIVRIRNVSTQFRYQKPQFRDDQATPLPSENYQPPAAGQEPGMMEIKTIRALPIHNNEALQREIRGLTERPAKKGTSAARIIER